MKQHKHCHLITCDPSVDEGYGVIEDGMVLEHEGKIHWVGKAKACPEVEIDETIDHQGQWLSPGLIDCHTHLIYAGHRANEFEMRLEGQSYEAIAKAGGGIVSTVAATRQASEAELLASASQRAKQLMQQGVRTLEIKSGYGLDLASELKMLRVARQLGQQLGICVKTTFLGAHALPPEYQDRADAYIDLVCHEMLPRAQAEGLVDAVDVFCEGIGFTLEQSQRVLTAAVELGLPVKIHAEQLSDLGGTVMAASLGALSADHLEYVQQSGIEAMAQNQTVAVLLPGAFYFLRETQKPPIEALREAGVPIAIATDSNPGSSPTTNLLLMMNMACTLWQMTPVEAWLGVTRHAAQALGLGDTKGQIKAGFDADMVRWDISQPAELVYRF